MPFPTLRSACVLFLCCSISIADDLRAGAEAGLERAVRFFRDKVSTEGGYLWQYSADLSLREGEGKASTTTIWVQPPGTPAVGMALLDAYERTRKPYLLAAARDAGRALVRGQLHSGGWSYAIYLDAETRKKYAYRVDGQPSRKAKNISIFDDNTSQSALRFLARLDKATGFADKPINDAALRGIDAVLGAQHANGAWSQVWDGPVPQDADPKLRASFPDDSPRTYPGGDYWWHYTLNDNAMSDTIDLLLEVASIYDQPRYRDAAIRAGDFLLRAQLPEPQPGWAQQYDKQLHPVWARKFEPPAVSGSESQRVVLTLIRLHAVTGEKRFLEPVAPAIAWMKRSLLPDGQLARFYELKTNRPLYMTREYAVTYEDTDLPTHYAFKVKADLARLEAALADPKLALPAPSKKPSDATVRTILAGLDERGAWVEEGTLKYHKVDGKLIRCETFIRNVNALTMYLAE